ncbi:LysR family transcriptional regulator [Tistrella bauzanensis]|uniref:LysR family transcriptional regulator n=1 Tax=Tistrella bauzanensis TaxID=657419 RepID=A0ABQ1IUS8_9PROT|nr:LysR family transcriptional regulator [Tistrella bauzanensis]GGB53055.1 LysR family transcriptional regulator [Tistrella bauzanensis]
MIDRLEFLLALSREHHFGRAAQSCGVSQPTLSAGIKALEDTMGAMLVERGSRFRGFTPEGLRVLDWARRIVGDARAMRQEIDALKRGLSGTLRIAVIPTALGITPQLTTAFRARNPDVRFSIRTCTSTEVLKLVDDLAVEAGVTYLDNEPLGRVGTVPLYRERYHLITATDSPAGRLAAITWADAARLPLCLLTPDMQNRRIIDRMLKAADADAAPVLESNSVSVLSAHVRTTGWSTIMPAGLARALGLVGDGRISAIPLTGPDMSHEVGLVAPHREPMMPLTAALFTEVRRLVAAGRLSPGVSDRHDRKS